MGSIKTEDFGTEMKRILHNEYLELREDAKTLSKDNFGDKVLRLRDDSILKLFRIKHLISSARLYPYSLRFVRNAKRLSALNIPTVEVINWFKIPSIKRTAVQYKKLEGDTLPRHLNNNAITKETAQAFGVFVATLHNKGVYFRSIHLENIIVLPDKSFGLIDISDMMIYRHPLSLRMRNKNFYHLTRYETHRNLLKLELMTFIHAYSEQSNISGHQLSKFEKNLLKHFNVYS